MPQVRALTIGASKPHAVSAKNAPAMTNAMTPMTGDSLYRSRSEGHMSVDTNAAARRGSGSRA